MNEEYWSVISHALSMIAVDIVIVKGLHDSGRRNLIFLLQFMYGQQIAEKLKLQYVILKPYRE
jgi:hypothetical protein